MDMGFSQEACEQALRSGNTIQAATELLLSGAPIAPPPVPQPPVARAVIDPSEQVQQIFDMDIGDNEEMMRAIAMSLGQSFDALGQGQSGQGASTSAAATEKKKLNDAKKEEVVVKETEAEVEPLAVAVMNDFTETMLTGALTRSLNLAVKNS